MCQACDIGSRPRDESQQPPRLPRAPTDPVLVLLPETPPLLLEAQVTAPLRSSTSVLPNLLAVLGKESPPQTNPPTTAGGPGDRESLRAPLLWLDSGAGRAAGAPQSSPSPAHAGCLLGAEERNVCFLLWGPHLCCERVGSSAKSVGHDRTGGEEPRGPCRCLCALRPGVPVISATTSCHSPAHLKSDFEEGRTGVWRLSRSPGPSGQAQAGQSERPAPLSRLQAGSSRRPTPRIASPQSAPGTRTGSCSRLCPREWNELTEATHSEDGLAVVNAANEDVVILLMSPNVNRDVLHADCVQCLLID